MHFLREHYPKLAVLISMSLAITFGYHNLIPGHKVEFNGSYLLHFMMDTVITGVLLFIVIESNVKINNFFDRFYKWDKYPVKRLLSQIVSNSLVSSLLIILSVMFYSFMLSVFYPAVVSQQNVKSTGEVFKNAAIMFVSILLLYQFAYIALYFFRQWTKSLVEAESLKRENLSSQLQALQVQVNPHFLFNSLSSLASLINEDGELATKFVEELAGVYRYLLQQKNEPLVRISEEMQFISSYIYLHKSRCGNGLNAEIMVNKKDEEKLIPPQTIQILVENAIKHNITSSGRPLFIKIYTKGGSLIVENNLQLKLSQQKKTGTGLQNIRDRYKLLCSKEISIESSDRIFRVSVPMLGREEIYERAHN
ncbi:MAG: sensor histidine kinase [Syntrophothermus sp.]